VRSPTVGLRPQSIALGNGAIWVANEGDDNVSRIHTGSGSVITIPVGAGPTSIAFGEGAVWVANGDDGTISRIDPQTNEVVETISVGNRPSGLAVGDGAIWVTVQAAEPTD
jgi:peptide/nickel transport system substrate-binding protein